ncbi:hypothetical protein [Aliiroseovarius sp.]|uniref:hypothetical protein n=1 Tax=Aliiroseovarius sp. TaxID=1872442 RepID=UPI00262B87FA|nr:hypothetical protein [Aliiroseovarius sp.]
MDISGPAPFGAQASIAAQMPTRTPPEVPVIDESRRTDRAQTDANTAHRDGTAADAARDLHAARRDPDVQTGPPPTFEVTLLEVEQDLQATLARLEATRNHDRDAEAVRPTAHADTDSAEADAAPAAVTVESRALEPAERVGVAQLEQPYDTPSSGANAA